MFTTEEINIIKLLLESNLKKVEAKPEIKTLMESSIEKIEDSLKVTLPISITKEEIVRVQTLVSSIEDNIKKYVALTGGANLQILETLKKKITGEMAYLSSFRDKFIYEIEFIEVVFKKEVFSKLVQEIVSTTGTSVTQAEKVVNIDDTYMRLRRDVHNMKQLMGNLKTKYSFFEKALQMITQSVSVAGKEMHNAKMDN